ncbi:MAG: hypothetical protein Nk1A_4980 [Endomicrobiia bacterium]|nr:MAG: hypothetical protein Nk1A_4980 [Endomicrobiia bacterium]
MYILKEKRVCHDEFALPRNGNKVRFIVKDRVLVNKIKNIKLKLTKIKLVLNREVVRVVLKEMKLLYWQKTLMHCNIYYTKTFKSLESYIKILSWKKKLVMII